MQTILKGAALAACALAAAPPPAAAHFLLNFAQTTFPERPGDVPVRLVFWHPMEAGHAMDMEKPLEHFMLHKGARIDLMDRLTARPFKGPANTAQAWAGTVPVKRSGDYVLVTVPAPYFEASEDKYIQQITKSFLNRNDLPTDWAEPVGLKAEILPLTKPYNLPACGTFTGCVVADGKPVPGAEIEVEYAAVLPDEAGEGVQDGAAIGVPGGALVILSGPDGCFTYGVPKAGFWGFAALEVGPDAEHQGKPLSQDAVIWIRAWDME